MIKAILEDNGYVQFDQQNKTWSLVAEGEAVSR
jgi:hypothetical protein